MYPYMQKGLNFLLKDMDTNKNMFPKGMESWKLED